MATVRLAVRVCVVTALTTAAMADFFVPPELPAYCGGTVEVREDDTCASLADFAGLPLAKWQTLNPSVSCNGSPQTGSQVCVGDKLSFCNNLYYSNAGDTCKSIDQNLGRIISSAGGKACADPISMNTPLCVADSPNACAVGSIGDVAISTEMQDLFAGLPDYCTLVMAPGADLAPFQMSGIQSLQLTLAEVTPEIEQILPNAGHPELNAFQKQLAVESAQSLVYIFVPGYLPGNQHLATFSFERQSEGTGGNRKLQKPKKLPMKYWYGGTHISVNWSRMKYW